MDSKYSKLQIPGGSIARNVLFRALFLASAISIVSLIRFLPTIDLGSLTPKTYDDCIVEPSKSENVSLTPGSYLFQSRVLNTFWGSFDSLNCKKELNLISSVVKGLMGKRLLHCEANSLCIGEVSHIAISAMQQLGFSNVHNLRFFSLNKKKIVNLLEYQDESFDFVLSKDLDKVSVPSLLVLEVERILKPGGIGAIVVVGDNDIDTNTVPSTNNNNIDLIIRSVSSVSSLLRSSSVVHVGHVNEHEHNLIVFKKRSENITSSLFYQNKLLQADCASVNLTKPFMKLIEPLVEEKEPLFEYDSISYLPKFVDVSSKKHLVFVNIGVGELVVNKGVNDWFPPSYPIDQKAFSVYFVHYNTSILLSHVKQPHATFVYHPGLAGKIEGGFDGDLNHFPMEEKFDFLAWFKETVQNADFVVLKMNIVGKVEMKFLKDIYESGAICLVNELFLSCSESEDDESMSRREQCMDIYKGLRSNGVYVHQWWDTELYQGPNLSHVQ